MTTVVGIGSCGIDYFAIVPHLLGPDEKINAERLEVHAGGVTGNNLTQDYQRASITIAQPEYGKPFGSSRCLQFGSKNCGWLLMRKETFLS